MSEREGVPAIGAGWVLGSILVGAAVAGPLSEGGEMGSVAAVALAVAAVLLSIGLAAEKVVLAIEGSARKSSGSGRVSEDAG